MSTLRKICPRRNFLLPVLCVLLMLSYPGAAWADIGPKPSVQICFTGMDPDVLCYGTLLSERDSTGPASVWNGDEEFALWPEGEFKIWKAFVDYKDKMVSFSFRNSGTARNPASLPGPTIRPVPLRYCCIIRKAARSA